MELILLPKLNIRIYSSVFQFKEHIFHSTSETSDLVNILDPIFEMVLVHLW